MAIDFAALSPTATTLDESTRSAGRKAEPNPFVDKGWLRDSYNSAKELTVPSADAASLVNMIRTAANRENLGVSVQVLIGGERWDGADGMPYLRALPKFVADGTVPDGYDPAEFKATAESIKRKKATVKYMAKDRRERKSAR